jgi:hypothetical protein
MKIENIINNRADRMIEQYNTVKRIKFPKIRTIEIFNLKQYSLDEFKSDFGCLKNENNIVYFILAEELPFTYEKIKEKFTQMKLEKGRNYHISKINDKILWEKDINEKYLYVGSKENKAIKRFQQHLGIEIKQRSTYSLYLKDWWPDNKKIIIRYFVFGSNIENESLQIIEDLLWDEYTPLFGKKGATFNKKMKIV